MKLNKKKVIFAIWRFSGSGPQRVLVNLLENLDRKKIEPSCIICNSNHVFWPPLDIKTRLLGPGNIITQIEEIIDTEKPDIVFGFLGRINLAVILAGIFSHQRPKLIVTERTTLSFAGTTPKTIKNSIKALYPKAHKIIAISEGVKKDLVENFNMPEEKIQVIYNGVDIEKVRDLAKEEVTEHPWFKENMPIIINVASLKTVKGQQYLLKAFKIARKKVNCRLVILGKGRKENELKRLSEELNIQNDVAFLGFQNNPFKFMTNSSVFVLSSIYEGLPNVILESMVCDTPVISTDCPSGPNEIIKDGINGILVPVKNEKKLAETIINLLNNKSLVKKISSNVKKDIKKFSIEKMVEEYSRLFR